MVLPLVLNPTQSAHPECVWLAHRITYGASGAIASQTSDSGVTAVVVGSTDGRWTFTFEAPAQALLGMSWVHDSQGTITGSGYEIFTGFVASTRTVTISHVIDNAEADPTSGNVVDFLFLVKQTDTGMDQ